MATSIESTDLRVERLLDAPIIDASTDPSIGTNIQGPSLIRAPDWLEAPLGRYYLYFADHKGSYIRLAYADALTGPWNVHAPASPARAPQVSAGLQDAVALRYAAWRFRPRLEVACGLTLASFKTC